MPQTHAAPKTAAPARRKVWVGLTQDAPLFAWSCAGVTFHKQTFSIETDKAGNPVIDPSSGNTKRNYRQGQILEMTEAQIEKVTAAAAKVRIEILHLPDLMGPKGEVVERDRIRARRIRVENPLPGDTRPTLGRFLYILAPSERLNALDGAAWRQPTLSTE